mgnify:CR=1 FL=1|jgi:hypothetical protein
MDILLQRKKKIKIKTKKTLLGLPPLWALPTLAR